LLATTQAEDAPPPAANSVWVVLSTLVLVLSVALLVQVTANASPCASSAFAAAKTLAAQADRAMAAGNLMRAIQLVDAGLATLDHGQYDYDGYPSQRMAVHDDTGQHLSVAHYDHRIGYYAAEYANKMGVLQSRLDAYAFSYACPVP
jgi:hypothetical protein